MAAFVMSTQDPTNVGFNTAVGNGTLVSAIIPLWYPHAHGMCWGLTANPTIAVDDFSDEGQAVAIGPYTSNITGLLSNTTYHVRAYGYGISAYPLEEEYGEDIEFTTPPDLLTLTTNAVTQIGAFSAVGNGTLNGLGVDNPTAHGIVWSTSPNPTLADNSSDEGAASAVGAFTSIMTGLEPNTTYYVRAYATNSDGTGYGNDATFTTLEHSGKFLSLVTLTRTGVSVTGQTQYDPNASLGGNLSSTLIIGQAFRVTNDTAHIPNIRVDEVFTTKADLPNCSIRVLKSADNTIELFCEGDTLAGPAVTVSDINTTYYLTNEDTSVEIHITRTTTDAMGGATTVEDKDIINNTLAGENVTDAARITGQDHYTCIGVVRDLTIPTADVLIEVLTGSATVGFDTTSQTIPDHITPPAGITFAATTTLDGLTGVERFWIRRRTTAGSSHSAASDITLEASIINGSTTKLSIWQGTYRVADDSLNTYNLFVGEDAQPDFDAPPEDSGNFPFVYSVTPPVSGEKVVNVAVRNVNQYGLFKENIYAISTVVDTAGDEIEILDVPQGVMLVNKAGGFAAATCRYIPATDINNADIWRIYYTIDGTTPSTSSTMVSETMKRDKMWGTGAWALSNYSLGPFVIGTTVKVAISSYRTSDAAESELSEVVSLVIDTDVPQSFVNKSFFTNVANVLQTRLVETPSTIIVDSGSNTYIRYGWGFQELWADTVLVWRIIYDSSDTVVSGIWSTFLWRDNDPTSGAGTGSAGEPALEYDSNKIYVIANGTRSLEIDLATTEIRCLVRHFNPAEVGTSARPGPYEKFPARTFWQVQDRFTGGYFTVSQIGTDSIWKANIPWKQRTDVLDFPTV